MKHTITVLQDDIDNGRRNSADNCAIALAAKRDLFRDDILVGSREIGNVNCSHLAVFSPGRFSFVVVPPENWCKLPDEARDFIGRFDTGQTVEPFKFTVELQAAAGLVRCFSGYCQILHAAPEKTEVQ